MPSFSSKEHFLLRESAIKAKGDLSVSSLNYRDLARKASSDQIETAVNFKSSCVKKSLLRGQI